MNLPLSCYDLAEILALGLYREKHHTVLQRLTRQYCGHFAPARLPQSSNLLAVFTNLGVDILNVPIHVLRYAS